MSWLTTIFRFKQSPGRLAVPPALVADDVVYDVVLRRLDEQIERVDSLNDRASTIVVFASTALPLFVAVFDLKRNPSALTFTLVTIGAGLWTALVALAYLVYRVADWEYRPDIDELLRLRDQYDAAKLRQWVIWECVDSIRANEDRLKQRGRYLRWTVWLLIAQTVLLGTAAFAS